MTMKLTDARKLANELAGAIQEGLENVSQSQLGKNDSLVSFLVSHNFVGKDINDNEDFVTVLDVKWPTDGNDKRKNQKIRSDIKSIATVAPHYDAMKNQCIKLSKDKDIQKAYPQCSPAQMFKRLTTLVKKETSLGSLSHSKAELVKKASASAATKSSIPAWSVDPIGHLKARLGQLDKNKFDGLEAVGTALDNVTAKSEEVPEEAGDLMAAFAALSEEGKHKAMQALVDAGK